MSIYCKLNCKCIKSHLRPIGNISLNCISLEKNQTNSAGWSSNTGEIWKEVSKMYKTSMAICICTTSVLYWRKVGPWRVEALFSISEWKISSVLAVSAISLEEITFNFLCAWFFCHYFYIYFTYSVRQQIRPSY